MYQSPSAQFQIALDAMAPKITCVKLVLVLVLCSTMSVADTSSAQTFSTLYSFSALQNKTNADGAVPLAALTCSGSALYGTALVGGAAGNGTVFAIQLDGTGFTNLHSFAENGSGDGVSPRAPLILAEGRLYGTTAGGGATSNGTVFCYWYERSRIFHTAQF